MYLNKPPYNILHWLAVLIENREFDVETILALEAKKYLLDNFKTNYEDYDLIIGYRADDSYFSFAQDFFNNTISLQQLANAMKLGNLGEQIALKSKKAFSRIKYINSEKVLSEIYYPLRMERDRNARTDYFTKEKFKRQKGDLFILEILDKEIKPNDERLR